MTDSRAEAMQKSATPSSPGVNACKRSFLSYCNAQLSPFITKGMVPAGTAPVAGLTEPMNNQQHAIN